MSTHRSVGFLPLQVPIATGLLHRWFIHWKVTLYFPTLVFQATGIGVSLLVTDLRFVSKGVPLRVHPWATPGQHRPQVGCTTFYRQIAFDFSTHRKACFSSDPFRQLRCLSPREIKRPSRFFSFLVTVARIWGKLRPRILLVFRDENSFLFHHIWGKTLRDGTCNLFGMRRHPNPALYPIKGIETCVSIARELGISLSPG